MAIEVYTEEALLKRLNNQEIKKLADNFKQYKENLSGNIFGFKIGNPNFGKDEPLTQPPQIRGILYKVHFKPNIPKDALQKWQIAINKGQVPMSDHILVYCSGKKNKNAYLLIDLLRPKGHLKLKDFNRLLELKSNFADPFRVEF